MQQKLKSVFRRSSKSRSSSGSHEQLESNSRHGEASSPRGDRQRVSSDRHGRSSIDSFVTGSATGRSRPVSSVYDDHRQSQAPARQKADSDSASVDPNGGAIANDYKAYLPALSPVNDYEGDEYMTLGGSTRHIAGESETRHEDNVADRDIARYSTSPDGRSRNTAGVANGGPHARITGK